MPSYIIPGEKVQYFEHPPPEESSESEPGEQLEEYVEPPEQHVHFNETPEVHTVHTANADLNSGSEVKKGKKSNEWFFFIILILIVVGLAIFFRK